VSRAEDTLLPRTVFFRPTTAVGQIRPSALVAVTAGVQAMGFPNETVGVVVALPFVCATAAMILWGYASDSRRERIWHIASAALFTALGLIIASISTSYPLVLLGLTIAIVGRSALPVINTLLPSLLRGPALAGGIAVYNTMAQFGGFFGPIVIGVLKQETNSYAAGLREPTPAIPPRQPFLPDRRNPTGVPA
jgi:MFS family permease